MDQKKTMSDNNCGRYQKVRAYIGRIATRTGCNIFGGYAASVKIKEYEDSLGYDEKQLIRKYHPKDQVLDILCYDNQDNFLKELKNNHFEVASVRNLYTGNNGIHPNAIIYKVCYKGVFGEYNINITIKCVYPDNNPLLYAFECDSFYINNGKIDLIDMSIPDYKFSSLLNDLYKKVTNLVFYGHDSRTGDITDEEHVNHLKEILEHEIHRIHRKTIHVRGYSNFVDEKGITLRHNNKYIQYTWNEFIVNLPENDDKCYTFIVIYEETKIVTASTKFHYTSVLDVVGYGLADIVCNYL
jgi:hypothetical protein